jgi:multiple sugar transport system ATP-binding protein
LADRIALLEGGRLQQVGTPLDLYANPANLFAARFIGMDGLNTMEGRFTTEPRPGIEIGKEGFFLPILNWKSIPANVPVTAGFRPNSVQRSPDGLPCLVEEVRDHGWKKTAFLRIGDRQILADCRALGEIRSGDSVTISLTALFAFDPVSGQRLA